MAATSVPHRWKYDVFVSFRGEDIRKSFMDHLFKDFKQKGINAFRDDDDLPSGEEISPQLYEAIETSRFLIVIFSKNYASSSWCLRELVKILECNQMRECKHEVRIIFYDVKPDVVRKQTESYAGAFAIHEIANSTEVAKWKEALFMAANLSGWDLQDMANGYESKFIDTIVKEIFKEVRRAPLHVGQNLIGVDEYVNEMNLSRFIGSDKVHMIGICGISGIGKTTLAKAIYNLLSIHFEECSFCEDVQGVSKQQGLPQVQIQLIAKVMKTKVLEISTVSEGIMVIKQKMPAKPTLLVLDDVDHREQLEALAGSHDWFFPGSFIIFTGKDKQLLRSHKVDEIYEVPFLKNSMALELFNLHAFGKRHPTKEFLGLSNQVVKHLQGHPLALKVLGCFLYEKPKHVWKSEVERLQTYPNAEIQKKLRPSYDGLDFDQKRIFLDIACSFIGENKDFMVSVLDGNNCFPHANSEVLVDKSLITISQEDNSLQMHELIRSMAREIVREESNGPGDENRLWILSDVCNVLSENKATHEVEILDLLLEDSSQMVHIDCKSLAHMKNLRILKICDKELINFQKPFELRFWKDFKVNYSGRLGFLSNKLRLLYWHGCPFKFFPSDFYPENIVAIDLSYSHIKNIWTSTKCFERLKVMKLKHCRNLTTTPDFTRITNLEELNLEGCVNLVNVHPSFGMLKRMVILNMKDCKRFSSFPAKVEMVSLEVMDLTGCSKVDKLPDFINKIQTLREFCVYGTAITELPSFLVSQYNLQVLHIGGPKRVRTRWWTSVPHPLCLLGKMQHPQRLVIPSLAGLCFLREIDFSRCNILEVSDSIGGLSCLETLLLSGNNFTSLPGCLSQLPRLKILDVSCCNKLIGLVELPPGIRILDASYCTSLVRLQGPLNHHDSTIALYCVGCPKLFRNLTMEGNIYSSITSHNFRNQLSSFLQYLSFPINSNGIFNAQERDFWYLEMIFYGNIIPRWFTNRSIGKQVKVECPQDWCYDKLRGYGICVVFRPKKFYSSVDDYSTPTYFVDNFDGSSLVASPQYCENSDRDSIGIHEPDIIWFLFSQKYWKWREAKNFVTFSFRDNDDLEVKECGVRLVYDEDINEETDLGFIQDLPTPTKDGCALRLNRNSRFTNWSW